MFVCVCLCICICIFIYIHTMHYFQIFFSVVNFLRAFSITICWTFQIPFLHFLKESMISVYNSIYVPHYISWFAYVELSSHLWKEANLPVSYNLQCDLSVLSLVCSMCHVSWLVPWILTLLPSNQLLVPLVLCSVRSFLYEILLCSLSCLPLSRFWYATTWVSWGRSILLFERS